MKNNLKQYFVIISIFTVLFSCKKENSNQQEQNISSPYPIDIFVGTYTNANSKGIYFYRLNADGKLDSIGLVAESENPSYLAFSESKDYLFAVNENENGIVESYQILNNNLKLIDKTESRGAHPCYISTIGDKILIANYSSGNITMLKHKKHGGLTDFIDVQQHSGSDKTDRQSSPHAHFVAANPQNSEQIFAADLGTNEIWEYKLKENLALKNKFKLAPGAGPRHITFHPNGKWLYVLNELNNTITQFEINRNELVEKFTVSTLSNEYHGENTGADIHISPDGKFLYASNRGENSIAIFKINNTIGDMQIIKNEAVKGKTPRNFTITKDGKFLLVANQESDNIISFERNYTTGLLTFKDSISAATPVCLLLRE